MWASRSKWPQPPTPSNPTPTWSPFEPGSSCPERARHTHRHGGISLPPAPWWGSGIVNSLGGCETGGLCDQTAGVGPSCAGEGRTHWPWEPASGASHDPNQTKQTSSPRLNPRRVHGACGLWRSLIDPEGHRWRGTMWMEGPGAC